MKPVSCNCEACRLMCACSVCVPTPDEARALIKAYPDRMGQYEGGYKFVAPATKGHEGKVLHSTRVGGCTFFDGKDCELHARGMKPLEGRIAHHSIRAQAVRMEVLKHWPKQGKRYESVCKLMSKA